MLRAAKQQVASTLPPTPAAADEGTVGWAAGLNSRDRNGEGENAKNELKATGFRCAARKVRRNWKGYPKV